MGGHTRHLVETAEKRAGYFAKLLKLLCSDLGPHPSGTKAYEQAALLIHKELESALPVAFLDRYLDFWATVPRPEIIHRARRLTVGVAENCAGTSDAGFNGIIKRIDSDGVPYGIVDEATGEIAACITVSKDVNVQPEYLVGGDVLSLPRFVIRKKPSGLMVTAVRRLKFSISSSVIIGAILVVVVVGFLCRSRKRPACSPGIDPGSW